MRRCERPCESQIHILKSLSLYFLYGKCIYGYDVNATEIENVRAVMKQCANNNNNNDNNRISF